MTEQQQQPAAEAAGELSLSPAERELFERMKTLARPAARQMRAQAAAKTTNRRSKP